MSESNLPTAGGIRIEVDGRVQGVGFRPWVHGLAQAAAIRGRVWNDPGGVTIEAFGDMAALRQLVDQLEHPPMPAARVHELRCRLIPDEDLDSFEIVASRDGHGRSPSIPPDLATCEECGHELRDPHDRRYCYPLINCTRCGPRYTICLDVPYDRPSTTMAAFRMCEACRAEYNSPADRRFHAQPNACPACGPRLRLVNARGVPVAGEPIATAARLLRAGRIVAVKGLGGYHVACDATNGDVVSLLRVRKHRDEKPFAAMAPNLDAAEALACLTAADRQLLAAASRPIVLVPRRSTSALADAIAPGNVLVGLMLPYTPLHELLLTEVKGPLVMTSGNRSNEPMVCDDGEALRVLAGHIADFLLQHDRAIANRCDDSVARVIAGQPVLLRRARGFVPSSIRVAPSFPRRILACGAHLKNTFCLAAGEYAWLGPHVGDLETHEACTDFESSVERFQRFVGIEPEVVVHDLHPDYFTTRYAAAHPARERIAVQHHHAHVASAIAEHHLRGPVIALAWDGTGYGTDGTAWGGELLIADCANFRRLGTFRPIALAGGDLAIREIWRIALALLTDAFDSDPPLYLPLFKQIDSARLDAARRMIARRLHAPLAHGIGRYFDAFGALILGKPESHHEAQVALQLSLIADAAERTAYPYEIAPASGAVPASVDMRPVVCGAVRDLVGGVAAATIAARFHATLVDAAVEMIRMAERLVGGRPIVLTGGCFQNARLVEDLLRTLTPREHVFVHREVPSNDGGIALGQAMVAAALLRGDRSEV